MKTTRQQAEIALRKLWRFMTLPQVRAIEAGMVGEEKQWFYDKVVELADLVESMPKTYETDGAGDDAIVWLHYFGPSADFYVTERDIAEEQHQAFGLADMGEPDLGYISIEELIAAGVELDLNWEPKTLRQVRERRTS